MNDLVQFYNYAAYMFWPAAVVAKVALLSALIAVAGGNQKPGQKLLTGVLAAHLVMSAFILYNGLISVGLPFGSRVIRTPVGEPAAVLSLAVGAAIALSLLAPTIAWRTRSEHAWANWTFWIAMIVALCHPFFNDWLLGGVVKSPMAVLPHPTLLAGCALAWMTGGQANRVAALALIAGAGLLGLHDALIWGIASSWLLVLYAGAAAVAVLAPDFSIAMPESSGERQPRERSPRADRTPKVKKTPDAPKWKLK